MLVYELVPGNFSLLCCVEGRVVLDYLPFACSVASSVIGVFVAFVFELVLVPAFVKSCLICGRCLEEGLLQKMIKIACSLSLLEVVFSLLAGRWI